MRCRKEALRPEQKKKVENLKKLMMFVALLSLAGTSWAQSARESSTDRLSNAGKVLHEIMAAPDNGIPEEVLEHARSRVVSSLADVMDEASPPAGPRTVGVRQRSLVSRAVVGGCKLGSKASIWS
jgi:hypothetical protein